MIFLLGKRWSKVRSFASFFELETNERMSVLEGKEKNQKIASRIAKASKMVRLRWKKCEH